LGRSPIQRLEPRRGELFETAALADAFAVLLAASVADAVARAGVVFVADTFAGDAFVAVPIVDRGLAPRSGDGRRT
jgi:hypothetical protein